MALSILDGTQTATTLSTILSSGQHITAHTVVSLGTQAITDMRSAVSGSVVSVSNFPASQSTTFGAVTGSVSVLNFPASQSVTFADASLTNAQLRASAVTIGGTVTIGAGTAQIGSVTASISGTVPISISSVTIGNSVTIGSLPAISGTVTANGGDFSSLNNNQPASKIQVGFQTIGGDFVATNEDGYAFPVNLFVNDTKVENANPLPISGTVTANSSNGSLTTRFGSVTTANTAFATSAVTNTNRKYLLIQNITTASNVITVGIGFTPTTTQGIQLFSGAGLTFEGSYIPTGAVNLLSSVTASCYTILEA